MTIASSCFVFPLSLFFPYSHFFVSPNCSRSFLEVIEAFPVAIDRSSMAPVSPGLFFYSSSLWPVGLYGRLSTLLFRLPPSPGVLWTWCHLLIKVVQRRLFLTYWLSAVSPAFSCFYSWQGLRFFFIVSRSFFPFRSTSGNSAVASVLFSRVPSLFHWPT